MFGEASLIDTWVATKMIEKRVAYCKMISFIHGNIVGLGSLLVILNTFLGAQTWMTTGHYVGAMIHMVILGLLNTFPDRLINKHSAYIWSGLLMSLTIFWYAFGADSQLFSIFGSMSACLIRMLWSVGSLHIPATIVMNSALSSLAVFFFDRIALAGEPKITAGQFAVFEFFICMSTIIISDAFLRTTHSELVLSFHAGALRNESSAVTTLLNTMCDAVVELDPNLRISEHSPGLAAILTLDSSRSLKDATLQQYMPSFDDRRRFEQMIDNHRAEEYGAGAVNVEMRDSIGTKMNVEILSAKLLGMDNRTRQLIGVRELEEDKFKCSDSDLLSGSSAQRVHRELNEGSESDRSQCILNDTVTPASAFVFPRVPIGAGCSL